MPEDDDVPEDDEDDAQRLSKPRMPSRFIEDDDDEHSENGEDIEEEYVSTIEFSVNVDLMVPLAGNRCGRYGDP